jgi:myo-inositol-1(or 4)-monophosphatase
MNAADGDGIHDGIVRQPSSVVRHPLADQLVAAVRRAGTLARDAFGRPMRTWLKEKASPVSEIDIAVDALLREALSAIAPDAAWLSEESEDSPARLDKSKVWIVDPIDGTRAFIAGRPDWAVSVALAEAGRPVLAALYAPMSEEFYLAAAVGGATRNGAPIRVSTGSALAGARIAGPKSLVERLAAAAPGLIIAPRGHSLALRLARVAEGTLDIAIAGRDSRDWDLAAADLLVHEAGGALTTVGGTKLAYNGATATHGVLLAAGNARHQPACALLREQDRLPQ